MSGQYLQFGLVQIFNLLGGFLVCSLALGSWLGLRGSSVEFADGVLFGFRKLHYRGSDDIMFIS
jgi:hypothetical protein